MKARRYGNLGRETKKKQSLAYGYEFRKDDGSFAVLETFHIVTWLVVTWVYVYANIIELYTSDLVLYSMYGLSQHRKNCGPELWKDHDCHCKDLGFNLKGIRKPFCSVSYDGKRLINIAEVCRVDQNRMVLKSGKQVMRLIE